jgi:hypothetical protein
MGGCVYTGWGPYLTPDQDCPTCWPSGFVMRQSVHGAIDVNVIRMPAGEKQFSRPTPGLLFNGHQGFHPRVCSERRVRLNTHLHQVQMLKMSGAIPLLPLYAFMVCMGHQFLHS